MSIYTFLNFSLFSEYIAKNEFRDRFFFAKVVPQDLFMYLGYDLFRKNMPPTFLDHLRDVFPL